MARPSNSMHSLTECGNANLELAEALDKLAREMENVATLEMVPGLSAQYREYANVAFGILRKNGYRE